MSHDLSQPIRTGWEKEISEKTDESTKEGPHSVGVWTLKILKHKEILQRRQITTDNLKLCIDFGLTILKCMCSSYSLPQRKKK